MWQRWEDSLFSTTNGFYLKEIVFVHIYSTKVFFLKLINLEREDIFQNPVEPQLFGHVSYS